MPSNNNISPRNRRPLWVAGTTLTALAALATAVFTLRSAPAGASTPPATPPAMPVSVAAVVASDVSTWDEFSGRLEAVERVDVRSRVAGSVQSVHFREGALVNKGDLLITIDPAPYAAEVDRASAQVVAAQARQAYTKSEFDRSQRLLDEKAIAQREYDERTNALREAEANLRAAQAALQSAKLNLGYTEVRAPVAGRVGKLEITVGNLVAAGPGAPVLTTLVSVSPIYASFDADEQIVTRALRDLPAGASARAQLERIPVQMWTGAPATDASGVLTDKPVAGKLQLVDNQVDAKSGTVRVRAVFDNKDGALMPGQFARLRMGQPKSSNALLITERAVGTDQSKKFVMVVGEDNKATYREVTLGANVNGLRIVQSGLKPNERIVVNGLQRVRPGAVVAPQVVPMDAAKADQAVVAPKQS
ncbi:MAG TPA: efflux RND transporter periplasmic adaptor subunit [Burkholderiaceae bacterium]|nr:efflux RND transporter periplasmic adaptor subunit [Burkholderiaceae bacterium]